jgi:hypothetical protein
MGTTEPHSERSFWWSLRGFFAACGALLTTAVAVVGLFLPQDSSPDSKNVSIEAPAAAQPVSTAHPAPSPSSPSPSSPPPSSPPPASSPSPPAPAPPPAAGAASMGGEITDVQSTVDDPCCTFSVKVALTGFDGQDCALTSTLVAADGSQTDGDELTLTPEADSDSARVDVAVSAQAAGTYSVRFVLRDPDGTELERFTTEPFDVG